MKYHIYYSDGTTFCGVTGDVVHRRWGVIVVVHEDPSHNWSHWERKDYYWEMNGDWVGGDWIGYIDHATNPDVTVTNFCVGRLVSDADYQRILSKALAEMNPPKTGKLPRES